MSAENSNTPSGVIIIGAGLAGWHVIDAIRAKDKNIPITLITADSGDRYHKPMLTMAISQKKSAADLVRATGIDAAKAAQVTLLANTQVTDIDTAAQTVQLISALRSDPVYTNYATISYDKLVLAMGAHPIFPKAYQELVRMSIISSVLGSYKKSLRLVVRMSLLLVLVWSVLRLPKTY